MKLKLVALSMSLLLLSSCGEGVVVGKIDVPASREGEVSTVPKNTTHIENIYIEYQDKFETKVASASFYPKGIVAGYESPMVPLSTRDSDLLALGFITNISKSGDEAELRYNDSVIRLKVDDGFIYLNDKPGVAIKDKPFYNNSTIYVPIIPLLDILKIDYAVAGTDLTIGGMYTDDTGEPRNSTE